MNPDDFLKNLAENGWSFASSLIPANLIENLRTELENAYETCRATQVRNGIAENTDGTVHHLVGQGESFLNVLENLPLFEELERFFEGKFILNSYGGVLNQTNNPSYVARVHRDIRTFSRGMPFMANMLIMVDDFTVENGATYLMTGSHLAPEQPSDDVFYAKSDRAIGQAGSVLVFDSNLWHAAGINQTTAPRRALTLTFTRPYLKPQLDYPRALGYERGPSLSPRLRQLLGYNARIPANLDEWYQPPDRRMYQPGQG